MRPGDRGGASRLRLTRRPASEQLGATVEKLAVLVGVGVSPAQAWRYLAETGDAASVIVVRALDRGATVPDAVAGLARDLDAGLGARAGAGAGSSAGAERSAWAVLAAAWAVAIEAGAPLARCLADIAEALRAAGRVERDITAALAGPAATTHLVVALPLVALAAGALMGLDTLGVLFGSMAGVSCLVLGAGLVAAGRLWTRRLLWRARQHDAVPGITLDLVAVALSGGGSLESATSLVRSQCERLALTPRGDHRTTPEADRAADTEALRSVLALAARAGAPPGELLRQEAARLRRDAVSAATERAAALGVWLMVPLGVCILPAFFLLAVAPVLLSVLSSTAWG